MKLFLKRRKDERKSEDLASPAAVLRNGGIAPPVGDEKWRVEDPSSSSSVLAAEPEQLQPAVPPPAASPEHQQQQLQQQQQQQQLQQQLGPVNGGGGGDDCLEGALWARVNELLLDTAEGLIARLEMCASRMYENESCYSGARESKKACLLQLVEAVGSASSSHLFGRDDVMEASLRMVAANVLRPLPPTTVEVSPAAAVAAAVSPSLLEAEEEETMNDAEWPQRQVVYEFLLRFVICDAVDAKVIKKHLDQKFVLKLLELFTSDDARERDYLKTILHRIYGKVMALRSFIRRAIQNHFFHFVYEQKSDGSTCTHKGVSELLEILGSIINGFALPLKEEHRQYLKVCLVPLHKARALHAFNVQLTYCMTQYVEKDSRLAEPVILGILKYWPVTNTTKEVIFLNEIEELLELTQPAEFEKIMVPLFTRLSACIESPHFQVSERVLFLWNNECIVQLFNTFKSRLFPMVISALYKNSKDHWNSTVHGLTYNVSKLLADSDPKLFDECSEANVVMEVEKAKTKQRNAETWKALERQFEASGLSEGAEKAP